MIEMKGVSEDQIRRLGHWQAGAMEKHYLSALPRIAMRVMAGSKSHESGRMFLKRDLLEPPEQLQKMIFPLLDNWMMRHRLGEECQRTLSCRGFLNLLKEMRKVILQDAVILMDKYPRLFVWSHQVFRNPLFEVYKSQLLTAMESTPDPLSVSLEALMPEVASEINSLRRDMANVMANVDRVMASVERNAAMVERIEQRQAGGVPLTTSSSPEEVGTTGQPPVSLEHGIFKMSRKKGMTVADLWNEWSVGIDGKPPIKQLEAMGTGWRACDSAEQRFFQRRKAIIDLVEANINAGLSEEGAVAAVDSLREGKSLNALYDFIKSGRGSP
jgi:hypothetical protein